MTVARTPPTLALALFGLFGLSFGAGCRNDNVAGALAQAPTYAPADQTRCGVTRSHERPLIIEWPAHDRSALETLVAGGQQLVAVRYEGCEMELVRGCAAPGQYRYHAVQPKRDDYTFKRADDLYAKIPLGAASLEAELERHGQLTLGMTVIGRYEGSQARPTRRDLRGECERATHVIAGLSVGAFRLSSGADASVRAGGGWNGIGGGAGSSAERGFLRSDGDPGACEGAPGEGPPEGCRALLRVEALPIREPAEVAAARARRVCPRGAALIEGGSFRPSVQGVGVLEIDDFCLDRAEVRVADYADCAATAQCSDAATTASWDKITPAEKIEHGELCNGDRRGRRRHPVNCVTWHQAEAYCRAVGGRLPTEFEWEWAARGGEQERAYAWGEQEPGPRLLNACGRECARARARAAGDPKDRPEGTWPKLYDASDGEVGTAPVGSFPAGRGRGKVDDLAGNVWEWTASSELTYRVTEDGPFGQGGPDTGRRASRGGGFLSANDDNVRTAARKLRDVKDRRADLGFRCAYDP